MVVISIQRAQGIKERFTDDHETDFRHRLLKKYVPISKLSLCLSRTGSRQLVSWIKFNFPDTCLGCRRCLHHSPTKCYHMFRQCHWVGLRLIWERRWCTFRLYGYQIIDLILTNSEHAFETDISNFHKMITTCFKSTYYTYSDLSTSSIGVTIIWQRYISVRPTGCTFRKSILGFRKQWINLRRVQNVI